MSFDPSRWSVQLFSDAAGCSLIHAGAVMPGIVSAMQEAGITTVPLIAHFLGQTGHESLGFTRMRENLDYRTADRLIAVFGRKRFPDQSFAAQYLRDPEKLARYVYGTGVKAKELGNLSERDGWDFIGRGYIGTTGRYNYERLAKATGMHCVEEPAMLERPLGAARSATFFWNSRKISQIIEGGGSCEDVTRQINSALEGLADREKRTARVFQTLEAI